MITFTTGNLLEDKSEALVNTVNTVGVMGKGIALAFKKKYPDNMKEYVKACKEGKVVTGKMFITRASAEQDNKWIVNFPTKQHWSGRSQMEWVDDGLVELKRFIVENNIKSIAIPALGAGLGGLNWFEVKSKIVNALSDLTEVDMVVYEPLL